MPTYTYAIGRWRWNPTEFFGHGAHVPPADSVCVLDYRNRSQQSTAGQSEGCGLFAFSGAVPDDLVPLGTGYAPELLIASTARQEMQLRLGLGGLPAGDTLAQAAVSCYMDFGDPSGEQFAKPLDPDPAGNLEMWLEWHSCVHRERFDWRQLLAADTSGRANRLRDLARRKLDVADEAGKLPEALGSLLMRCGYSRAELRGGAKGRKAEWQQLVSPDVRAKHGAKLATKEPQTSFSESWPNNATNIAVTAQSQTWAAITNSFSVSGGRAMGTGNFADNVVACNSAVSSADHFVQVAAYLGGQPCIGGPMARASRVADTGYIYAYHSSAGARRIYKRVGGVLTQLSTAAYTPAAGDVWKTRPAGSSIGGTVNGASSSTVTDPAITGNLYGGLWLYDDTNAHTFNQFGAWSIDDELNPPVAAFSATPLSGLAPLSVAFTDASTNTPTSWLWERTSDGTSWATFSTAQNPTASFSAGTWGVRLTSTNAGGSNTLTRLLYVTVTAPNRKAVAGSYGLGLRHGLGL